MPAVPQPPPAIGPLKSASGGSDPLLASLIDPPDARSATDPVNDLVSALVSELVQPAEARPAQTPPNGAEQQTAVYVPYRSGSSATMALASFWCGLGVIPPGLDASGLADLMAEFGAALREAVAGFASMLGSSSERAAANPLMDGHFGLRRFVEQRDGSNGRLDVAVRDVFALAAQREDAYIAAVRCAVTHALRSMTPSVLEARFGSSLHGRRQSVRRAELIEIMFNMETQLVELAEAQFQKELNERMRPRTRKLLAFEWDGSHG